MNFILIRGEKMKRRKSMDSYIVYDNRTDEPVFHGTLRECQNEFMDSMGRYRIICDQRRKNKE